MTQTSDTPTIAVPVAGGDLRVHDFSTPEARASADGPLVLLVHGITANGLSWGSVAEELRRRLPGARLWAPDLRGRAGSADLTGPFGMGAHVADLMACIDHAGAAQVVLAGHSMGGFVVALASARHRDRLAGTVLVDGGFSFGTVPAENIDAALQAVIGPAMTRLSMTFADTDAYLDFWAQQPAVAPTLAGAFGPQAAAAMRAYLEADLRPAPDGSGAYVSSCNIDAIRADGSDILADPETHAAGVAASSQGLPMELVWAERGLMDEPIGLYDDDRIAALALPEAIAVTGVDDVNHYTILFDPRGVGAVADAVERLAPAAD